MAKAHYPGPQRQRGIGMLTVFLMLAIGIFLGIFAIKVVPQYIESWTVQTIVEDANANPELLKQTKAKIYDHLNGAYRQNNLWDLRAEDTVVLKRTGRNKGYSLKVEYEKRTNFLHNIYLVTAFNVEPEAAK